MRLYVMRAETTQETNRGGGGIELRQLVFLDHLPVAGGRRIDRGRLEDRGGNAIRQGTVNDVAGEERMNMDEFGKAGGPCMYVRVSGDPADIGGTGKLVIRVDIEDIFDCQSYAKEVPACRMYETLGLACGAGRLQGIENWIDEGE